MEGGFGGEPLVASARLDDRCFSSSQYATGAFPAAAPLLELRGSEPEQTDSEEVEFEPMPKECTYWITWERRRDGPESPHGKDLKAVM